jgi:hypothetical protein
LSEELRAAARGSLLFDLGKILSDVLRDVSRESSASGSQSLHLLNVRPSRLSRVINVDFAIVSKLYLDEVVADVVGDHSRIAAQITVWGHGGLWLTVSLERKSQYVYRELDDNDAKEGIIWPRLAGSLTIG